MKDEKMGIRKGIFCLILPALILLMALPVFGAGQGGQGAAAGSGTRQVTNMNLTGYPIAIQQANLSVAVNKRPQHNKSVAEYAYMIELERKTNVKINWIEWEPAQQDERRRLAFATNQLPDVFFPLSSGMVNYYGNQGQLMPLNNLVKNYAPILWTALQDFPDAILMMTNPDDGNWYSLVTMTDPSHVMLSDPDLYINKKWLDNLGLSVPQNISEFYNAMQQFKARDANGNGNPNDEIPFAFSYQEGSPEYSYTGLYIMFFPFGVAENNRHLQVVNGKLTHTFTMPQFREGVRFLANMYREGLIDPESFTNNRQQFFAFSQAREVGAAIGFDHGITFGANKSVDYVTLFLKGPNGENPVIHRNFGAGGPGSGCAISSACRIPEIAIRWIDEFYKPEMAALQMYGNLGMYLQPSTTPPIMYDFAPLPQGVSMDIFRFTMSDALGIEMYTPANLVPLPVTRANKKANDAIKEPYFIKDYLINFIFNEAELDEIRPMQTELETFAMNTLAQWIVRGTVDAEWDQVQQQLNRMRLPRYLELYQRVWDRTKAAR